MADGGGLLPGVRRVWGRFLSLLKTFASCKAQAEPSLPFLEQPKKREMVDLGWLGFFLHSLSIQMYLITLRRPPKDRGEKH